MDVVLGIAAKSLDAAFQLAKALHGAHAWAYEQPLSLQPRDPSGASGPDASALLLLSHDNRTAYILIATHAPAEEYLRAVASATQLQRQRLQRTQRAAAPDGVSTSAAGAAAEGTGLLETLPPLQRLQQLHEVAVNVLLLQLFLACDVVLLLLPTGQGLELTGTGAVTGAGGGPLSGATDWITRLRLLQGAKRALHDTLYGCQTGPAPRGRAQPQSVSRPPPAMAAGERAAEDSSASGLTQLRVWCSRDRSPTLVFVSPSDVGPEGPMWRPAPPPGLSSVASASSSSLSGPPPSGRAATSGSRSSYAQRGGAAGAADEPRDANWLLRYLLKRCRPVPLSSGPELPPPLCLFDPAALVLDSGPLALQPADVSSVVLGVLLDPREDDPGAAARSLGFGFGAGSGLGCGTGIAGPGEGGSAGRMGDGMARLQETLTAALAAAAARPAPAEPGTTAASRLGGTWMAAAAHLHEAALTAWREAAGQPLDWVPPAMEGGGVQRQAPGHAASTAHGRSRPRGPVTTASPAGSAARGPTSLESAAAWLAAGGAAGLAVRLVAELCREAADAALGQYTATTPPRYPERVHAAAVAAAVAALRAAAPPGPAATAAAARLRAACEEEWRRGGGGGGDCNDGRRQCSALSATGRPCTRPLHGPSEPHCSETTSWVTTTTTGSSLLTLPDPFDLQAANAAPYLDDGGRVAAAAPPLSSSSGAASVPPSSGAGSGGTAGTTAGGRAKALKKGAAASAAAAATNATAVAEAGAGGAATPAPPSQSQPPPQQLLPAHSRHLVVAVAQAADGSTHQCVLGPWVTVTRLGPAASYNDRRGLANQPGLNGCCLYPLTLHFEADSRGSGQRAGIAGRGPKGAARPGIPSVESTDSNTTHGASSAPGAGSDSEVGGVVLDEQSFPSLAEAAAAAQAGRQPQQPSGAAQRRGGSGKPLAGGKAVAGGDAAGAANREREQLMKAWPYPQKSGGAGGKAAGPSGGGGGGSGGAVRGQHDGAAAGGPRGRRGRGGMGPGAGQGGADVAAFPPLSGARDTKRVYVSYEYQTLDGRRFLATPQQLAAAGAAAAAKAAGRPTARDLGAGYVPALAPAPSHAGPPQQAQPQQPYRRGGRPPPGGSAAAATAAAGAASAGANAAAAALSNISGGGGGGSGAASFLLQHDAPLYLQPPPGLQPDPAAPSAQDGAAGWDPTPRRPGGLAQLRRIFVITPPSTGGEPLLASRPTVQFRLLQKPQLPEDAAAAAGLLLPPPARVGAADEALQGRGGGGGEDGRLEPEVRSVGPRAAQLVSGRGPAATVVQISLARPVPLPSDSLVVISLPLLYGLPAEWLGWGQGVGASDADGAGDASAVSAAADAASAATAVATAAAATATVGSLASGGVSAADAASASTDSVKDTKEGSVVGVVGGGAAASAAAGEVQGGSGGGAPTGAVDVQHGSLLPLVQLDERTPYEARLLAGSALFPISVATT